MFLHPSNVLQTVRVIGILILSMLSQLQLSPYYFKRQLCVHFNSLCPKISQYMKEFRTSTIWKEHWNITKSLLDDLSAALNYTISEFASVSSDDVL